WSLTGHGSAAPARSGLSGRPGRSWSRGAAGRWGRRRRSALLARSRGGGGAPARPRGESVAVTRILQPRWQLTARASARWASTPAVVGRLTCSTGGTSRGGGQAPGAKQPVGAGETRSKRSTRLLLVSATYTSPLQSTAMAVGCENSPGPTPRRPHWARKRPPESKTSTRLFSL